MAKKIYLGRATTLTPVEYIESTGTQYFDTGIIPDNTIKVEARIMITAHNADQAMPLFGCRDFNGATVTNAYILWCTPTSGQGAPSPQFNYNNATVTISSSPENTLLDVEYGNNYVKYGSQTYTGTTVGAGSPSCTMMLLGTNISGAAEGRTFLGRLYYFKIWKGGVLVRDYVPMVDDQGEGCLWDNVEQRAFYNDGTGSFLIGNATGGSTITTNIVRRIPKMYVGVNNVAKKVKAAYVGVNGVARQVYSRLPFVGVSRVIYHPSSVLINVALAATEDYIVHAGGGPSSSDPVKTVVAFNENDVKFDCADLNTAAHYEAGCTFVGKAVIASGKRASSGRSRTPQIITYDNNLVKAKPGDINASRFEHTLLADDTHMHVAGGCQYTGDLSSIEVYNTSFVRLSNPTSMTVSRRGAFGAKVGGYFVYCGGGTGSTSYADFYNSSNTRTRGSTPFPTNLATWYTKGITLKDAAMFFGGTSAEYSTTATFHKVIASYNSNLVYTTANMPYGANRQNGFDNNGELAFISAGQAGENSAWISRRIFWIYNSNLVRVGTYYVDAPTQSNPMYLAASNKKFAHFRPTWTLAGYPIWKFEF